MLSLGDAVQMSGAGSVQSTSHDEVEKTVHTLHLGNVYNVTLQGIQSRTLQVLHADLMTHIVLLQQCCLCSVLLQPVQSLHHTPSDSVVVNAEVYHSATDMCNLLHPGVFVCSVLKLHQSCL